MKKFLTFILVLVGVLSVSSVAMAAERTISSAAELQAFAAEVNAGNTFAGKVVELNSDIDLSGIEWSPIGGDSVYFAGEFNGNGFAIKNLTQTNGSRMGLFGLVEKAYIHDLKLSNVNFTVGADNARVGAIAGNLQYWNVLEDITIDGINITINGNDGLVGTVAGYEWKSQQGNVDVKNATITINGDGNVFGGHTAYGRGHVWDTGVVGNNAHWLDGTVQMIDNTNDSIDNPIEYVMQNYHVDCDVDTISIKIHGNNCEVGGFIGSDTYNSHSNYFVNCHVKGLSVEADAGTSQIIGGFIAWNNGTTSAGTLKGFEDCSASGTIVGDQGLFGGFVGQCGGRACEYDNATADVDIKSNGTAGGFAGKTAQYFTHKYTFSNCEAKGDVSGAIAGGFLGEAGLGGDGDNINIELNNCTAGGDVSGKTAGGIIGNINPELPATNWSVVEGTGTLAINNCTSSGSVAGDDFAGGMIGDATKTVATGDAKDDNKVLVKISGRVLGPVSGNGNVNQIANTADGDLNVDTTGTVVDIRPTGGNAGNNAGNNASSGISITYNGGNSFSTSKSDVPTGVEIDNVPVSFTGNGNNFTVSGIPAGAKWVTVRWNSTSVTTNFTPNGAYFAEVEIPKTGDMPIWAAIAEFLGF